MTSVVARLSDWTGRVVDALKLIGAIIGSISLLSCCRVAASCNQLNGWIRVGRLQTYSFAF